MADKVVVMYAGQVVENADVFTLFKNPKHPYTRSLLNSLPNEELQGSKLHVIEGVVPPLNKMERDSCRFAPRIPWIDEKEHEHNPELREISPGHFVRCTCYKNFYLKSDATTGMAIEAQQMAEADEVTE